MAYVCICNAFNQKQVSEGLAVKGKDFPVKPTPDDVYQLYHDVYEWCGLEYKEMAARPKCERCFAQFIDMAVDHFLSDKIGAEQSQFLKARALSEQQQRKASAPRVA